MNQSSIITYHSISSPDCSRGGEAAAVVSSFVQSKANFVRTERVVNVNMKKGYKKVSDYGRAKQSQFKANFDGWFGMRRATCAVLIVLAASAAGWGAQTEFVPLEPPVQDWFPKAPALAYRTGPTVEVSDAQGLIEALADAKPGQTILLVDGIYRMPHYVEIRADNVTLRSASGQRERVIIDGSQSMHGELLGFRACTGVTVADLTIQNVKWNGFKINSETNVQNLTIHNCIIHNIWQRGVKGVKVPEPNREATRPKQCRIQYCLFYNDRPKRLDDDEADIAKGNYIAGIDVMYARDWVISDNVFVGIQGRTGEGRGAIFLWFDANGCIVERNVIIDCDVGVQLGNAHRVDGIEFHCTGCVVRNNFITRAPEAGIVTTYTRGCKILHNTIHDPNSRMNRLLRIVFANDGLVIANNLISGPAISNESDSDIVFVDNCIKDATEGFVDPDRGNLHLTPEGAGKVDRVPARPDITSDIDGSPRGPTTYVGADEPSS
jgi:Right handed beta helix region